MLILPETAQVVMTGFKGGKRYTVFSILFAAALGTD
jgi:hypothetical protein